MLEEHDNSYERSCPPPTLIAASPGGRGARLRRCAEDASIEAASSMIVVTGVGTCHHPSNPTITTPNTIHRLALTNTNQLLHHHHHILLHHHRMLLLLLLELIGREIRNTT